MSVNKRNIPWECGNGFPEISCVNELLSGERLAEVDYKKKAEENMVNFIKERDENKKKMQLTFMVGGIATISFLTLILVVCMYTEVMSLPVKIVLVTIACAIFASGLYIAMQGERTIGYYQCKHCKETFIPSFYEYTMGMHMLTTRKLKCPHCGKKSWCKKVLTKSLSKEQ